MTYKQKKCNHINFVIGREAEIEMASAENGLQVNGFGYFVAFSIFR